MTKTERFVLSVISLLVGLGLAFVVKALVWRTTVGPVWMKAAVVGAVALIGFILFDRFLFLRAQKEIEAAEAKPRRRR